MKLHLLFVFLLAAPLIGRVLSSESASAGEAGTVSSTPAIEAPPAAELAPVATPASTDAAKPRTSTPAPTRHQPAERRASSAPAASFM